MPVVEINDLARVGQVNDVAAYMLPPEAWTLAENIRYSKGAPQVLDGWAQVFGTPGVAPHFALPVKGSVTNVVVVHLTHGGVCVQRKYALRTSRAQWVGRIRRTTRRIGTGWCLGGYRSSTMGLMCRRRG